MNESQSLDDRSTPISQDEQIEGNVTRQHGVRSREDRSADSRRPSNSSEDTANLDTPTSVRSEPGGDATKSWNPSGVAGEVLPDVPGHDVIKILGRGGMGMVLQARHRVLGRIVAVKMPLSGSAADTEERERFLREARATARLRHANICPVYEVGASAGQPYLTMAYIDGETLGKWAMERKPNAQQAATILARLSRAVAYAHAEGILHRDIKPGNVLVDAATEQPMLMDFGLAKELSLTGSELTQSGQILGTPAYMAPEQAAGRLEQIGTHSDVYALGAVLYYLLCGRAPFVGSSGEVLRQVQLDEPLPPRKIAPRIHADLETICLKAMAREPLRRYASAGAMADDLERFLAGEAILARREGLAWKAWRVIKRRPVTWALVAAMLLTIAAFSNYAMRTARLAHLERQIDQHRDSPDWTEATLSQVESLIDAQASLAPEQAAKNREQAHKQFAASVQRAIDQPRVSADDAAKIDARLDAFGRYDASRADELRKGLKSRLMEWQVVAELRPGQPSYDKQFDARAKQAGGDSAQTTSSAVATKIASQANMRVEAEFEADESTIGRFGILLGLDPEKPNPHGGYAFLVIPRRENSNPWQACDVAIMRGDAPLRRETLLIAPGRLRLTISRLAERLYFQINQLPTIDFQDPFPLTEPGSRVLGLALPQGCTVAHLRASTKPSPKAPTPLERGDELFSRNEIADALVEYRLQANASKNSEFGQEARYKEALCLIHQEQIAEAMPLLEGLTAESGARWPPLAFCQLWSIALKRGDMDHAYAVFEILASRYAAESLRPLVPYELVAAIVEAYHAQASSAAQFLYNEQRLRDLKRAGTVQDFFDVKGTQRALTQYWLYRSYLMLGDMRQARRLADELIHSNSKLDEQGEFRWIQFCETYCWLLRLDDEANLALQEINGQLGAGDRKERLGLLVERARIHAALGQRDAAERDLDELYRETPAGQLAYRHHSGACLLRGFFAKQRGDDGLARQAWLAGVPGKSSTAWDNVSTIEELAHALVLASLTEEFSAEDVELLVRRATKWLAKFNAMSLVKGIEGVVFLDTPPADIATAIRGAARRPELRELARQVAFRELPIHLLHRKLAVELFTELVGNLLGGLASDQEVVCRQAGEGLFNAYYSGDLDKARVFKLAMTWKGFIGSQGWSDPKDAATPPALRGPLAYLFGLRYRQLGREADSKGFFKVALDSSDPSSPLHHLSETELHR